mmetsp:Transcript_32651/g.68670  ORF Transcript_32651/g.68670 Transcript_32651/m.68670 type:complete len:150 (-) Transcript_32651:2512-2961(-)
MSNTSVNICNYLGQMDDWCGDIWQYVPNEERVCRLYFSPTICLPPKKLSDEGSYKSFSQLDKYTEIQAGLFCTCNDGNSPVISNGGETAAYRRRKIFVCKRFTVLSWNKFGSYRPFFYIIFADIYNHDVGASKREESVLVQILLVFDPI